MRYTHTHTDISVSMRWLSLKRENWLPFAQAWASSCVLKVCVVAKNPSKSHKNGSNNNNINTQMNKWIRINIEYKRRLSKSAWQVFHAREHRMLLKSTVQCSLGMRCKKLLECVSICIGWPVRQRKAHTLETENVCVYACVCILCIA